MNGLSSIIPPVGPFCNNHVQTKEQTLEGDVQRHAKQAKRELREANRLEYKAQKVFILLVLVGVI